jgi:general secretion pathway protein I
VKAPSRIRARRPVQSEAGYTLIEVLVALTILSLSLAVLFGIFSQSIARIHDTEQEMAARTLAHSLLAQTNAYGSPYGEQSGSVAGGLSWRLRIAPYPQHDDQIAAVHVAIVSVTVTWRRSGADRSLTLTTLQTRPKDDAQ